MIYKGKLAEELLHATITAGAKRKKRKEALNKIVQKYSKIYSH
jgi:hypothetical protein